MATVRELGVLTNSGFHLGTARVPTNALVAHPAGYSNNLSNYPTSLARSRFHTPILAYVLGL
jgi:hypothetical protein